MDVRLFFEDHKTGEGWLFENPVAEVKARQISDVRKAFQEAEEWRRQGFYLAGYVTYEAAYGLIEKKIKSQHELNQPLLQFFVFSEKKVKNWSDISSLPISSPSLLSHFQDNMGFEEYQGKIQELKKYFISGETYQTNFSLRRRFQTSMSSEELYSRLREKQKVSYAAYLQMPGASILSFSPELFVKKVGSHLTARPMKGTVPRGNTPSEDESYRQFLLNDEKNRAENVMIVDLLRNDMGRLAEAGSVRVENLFEVQTFETLHQMVTTIHAEIDPQTPLLKIFENLFPCGSITGAPKIRTMEIINALEKEPRGIYTGAVGFVSPENDFCFNVAIRTLAEKSSGQYEIGLGGGILFDSSEESEFKECHLKGQFVSRLNEDVFLFETFLFGGSHLNFEKLSPHWARLESSSQFLGFPINRNQIENFVKKELSPYSESLHRVRLRAFADGSLKMEATPWEDQSLGGAIMASEHRVNSADILLQHKTSLRDFYEEEYRKAQESGCYEIVFFNERDELTEGSRHNIFIRKGSVWKTPPISCGLLPGITRNQTMKDLKAQESVLKIDDLYRADEILLTNALRGRVSVKWKGDL